MSHLASYLQITIADVLKDDFCGRGPHIIASCCGLVWSSRHSLNPPLIISLFYSLSFSAFVINYYKG
jgi:hypothetical protein